MSFNSGATNILEDRNLYALNLSKSFVLESNQNGNQSTLKLDNYDVALVAMAKYELENNKESVSLAAYRIPHPAETIVELIMVKQKTEQKTNLELIRDSFLKSKEKIIALKKQFVELNRKEKQKSKMDISIDSS